MIVLGLGFWYTSHSQFWAVHEITKERKLYQTTLMKTVEMQEHEIIFSDEMVVSFRTFQR